MQPGIRLSVPPPPPPPRALGTNTCFAQRIAPAPHRSNHTPSSSLASNRNRFLHFSSAVLQRSPKARFLFHRRSLWGWRADHNRCKPTPGRRGAFRRGGAKFIMKNLEAGVQSISCPPPATKKTSSVQPYFVPCASLLTSPSHPRPTMGLPRRARIITVGLAIEPTPAHSFRR